MVRLYVAGFIVLCILAVPKDSAGQQGNLADLTEVRLEVAPFRTAETRLGLDNNDIKNHVFVLLRSKLPRLNVDDSAAAIVHIRITLAAIETVRVKEVGFFGSVQLMVSRPVSILKSRMQSSAYVREYIYIIRGPIPNVNNDSRDTLELLVTKFAADWYRDNPSK